MSDNPDESIVSTSPPPRKDDKLFGIGADLQTNACIAQWDIKDAYCMGYRAAAFSLAEEVCETGKKQDTLIYPIVYLYRHHIELALKSMTVIASELLDQNLTEQELRALGQHGLIDLWKNLKPLLNPVCKLVQEGVFPSEDIEGIESYINQLHEHDPDGQRFRYATVKQGKNKAGTEKPSLGKNLCHINIRVFATHMEKLAEYLESVQWWFDDLLDIKNDMKRRGL